jgi:hypothetical protein
MGYGIFNNWHKAKDQPNTAQTKKLDANTKYHKNEEGKTETPSLGKTLTKKLEHYRNKLLDLNRENPSIFLEEIEEDWFFDLGEKFLLGEKYAKKIIDNAIRNKKPVCIVPDSDLSEKAIEDRDDIKYLYKNMV